MEEAEDDGTGQAMLYIAYGELMHKLQLLELTMWQLKALQMKRGLTEAQAFAKITNWDGMTYGQMVESVLAPKGEWSDELAEAMRESVQIRNHLAHKFLRNFIAKRTKANFDKAAEQMADWLILFESIDEGLEAKVASMSDFSFDDLDDATKAEIDAMQPEVWEL